MRPLLTLLCSFILSWNHITSSEVTVVLTYESEEDGQKQYDTISFTSENASTEKCNELKLQLHQQYTSVFARDCGHVMQLLSSIDTSANDIFVLLDNNIPFTPDECTSNPDICFLIRFEGDGREDVAVIGSRDFRGFGANVFMLDVLKDKLGGHVYEGDVFRNLTKLLVPDFGIDHSYTSLLGERIKGYIDDIMKVVYDEQYFTNFRNWEWAKENLPSLSGVYFDYFYAGNIEQFIEYSLQHLLFNHRNIFKMLPILTSIDSSVTFVTVSRTLLKNSDFSIGEIDKDDVVPVVLREKAYSVVNDSDFVISPLLLRFVMETALLKDEFGSLDGKRLLEIGGGYGGMASVLQSIFEVKSYVIVDLAICGKLQDKFVSRHNSFFPYTLNAVASTNANAISSDIIFSFFAISELSEDVIDKYMTLYIRHAASGYLQLNFDDDMEFTRNVIASRNLVTAIDLFQKILKVHPCAVIHGVSPLYNYFFNVDNTGRLRIIWRSC